VRIRIRRVWSSQQVPRTFPPCGRVSSFHVRAGGKKCKQAAFLPRDSRALVLGPQTDRASAQRAASAVMPHCEP